MSLIRLPVRKVSKKLNMRKIIAVQRIDSMGPEALEEYMGGLDGKILYYYMFDDDYGICHISTQPFTLDQARRETEEEKE